MQHFLRRFDLTEAILFVMLLAAISVAFATPMTFTGFDRWSLYVFASVSGFGSILAITGRHLSNRLSGIRMEAFGEIAVGTALLVRVGGIAASPNLAGAIFGLLTTLALVVGFYAEAWQLLVLYRRIRTR